MTAGGGSCYHGVDGHAGSTDGGEAERMAPAAGITRPDDGFPAAQRWRPTAMVELWQLPRRHFRASCCSFRWLAAAGSTAGAAGYMWWLTEQTRPNFT